MTPTVRDLLDRASELPADERGQVFDELFDSLAGHDELDGLMDELERRGDLACEPDLAEVERRLRSADEPGAEAWRSGDEVLADLSRRLAEDRTRRADAPPPRREPRVTGKVGDLAGAALELPPHERAALAHAILETIERCDEPPEGPEQEPR